jgi:chromosome segregation ATPase
MMQDETIMFEKIAEIEAENKALEQQEMDIEERKKDLEQDRKILELNENQVKKYQNEISEHKETLRQLKLQAQKELLNQEDTSSILAEIEQLNNQKLNAKKEIDEIKSEKKEILSKADEAISSAKEIKSVLGNHNKNKKQIEELKSEICINQKQFETLKLEIQSIESQNSKLLANNETLLNENKKLSKIDPSLQEKLNEVMHQKNELLQENINLKKQKLFTIQISSVDNKHFQLTVPSTISGKHVFQKEEGYLEEQINNLIKLSFELDQECPERNKVELEAIYNKKITALFDPRMSNADYRKNRPNYIFQA